MTIPYPAQLPPLEKSDRQTRAEFERPYGALPQKTRTDSGNYYVASPVHVSHNQPHTAIMVGWALTKQLHWVCLLRFVGVMNRRPIPFSASGVTAARARRVISRAHRNWWLKLPLAVLPSTSLISSGWTAAMAFRNTSFSLSTIARFTGFRHRAVPATHC